MSINCSFAVRRSCAGVSPAKYISCLLVLVASFLLPHTTPAQVTISGFEDTSISQQDVAYIGVDSHIYFRDYNSTTGWQVRDLSTLANAPLSIENGSPLPEGSVLAFKDLRRNEPHVFYQGPNQHIYDLWSNANNLDIWYVEDLTEITGGDLPAPRTGITGFYDSVNNYRFIAYISNFPGHVNVFFFDGSHWGATDISAKANAPVLSAGGALLTSFKDDAENTEHVFYVGVDQNIYELYSVTNPNIITPVNISAAAGAPPATYYNNPIIGFMDPINHQEDIFYLGTDQHIHHIFYTFSVGGWRTEDLTTLTGAPNAFVNSSIGGFNDVTGGQEHVFFTDYFGDIYQFYTSGNSWYLDDISGDLSSTYVRAAGTLAGFKDDPDNQQHLFFNSSNGFGHVWYSGQWNFEDLSSGGTIPKP